MAVWLIVQKSNLEVLGSYEADEKDDTSRNRSHLMSEPLCVHLELEDGIAANTVKVELDGEDYVQSEDSDKVEALLESQWVSMRAERNRLLSASDYTQLADAPLSVEEKSAYATYRQALRDLPENTEDPSAPAWPEEP